MSGASEPSALRHAQEAADKIIAITASAIVGYIAANGNQDRYRAWEPMGPTWTTEKKKAVVFLRREDAEAVFGEDDSTWAILPVNAADVLQGSRAMGDTTIDIEDWTRDEVFLAQAIAFLSAERNKIKEPARYAAAFIPHFIDEAKRVLSALANSTPST